MAMSDYWTTGFASGFLGLAIGYFLGRFVKVKHENVNGTPIATGVTVDRHPFGTGVFPRIWRLALIALFIAATGFVIQFSVDQRQCNNEFRRTIVERTDANKASDQALYDLVDGFSNIPPETPDRVARVTEMQERFKHAYQERQVKRALNPYPQC